MIRNVYEVDPMVCPKCGGTMKIIAFITDYQAIDRIMAHLKLTFYKCRSRRVIDIAAHRPYTSSIVRRGNLLSGAGIRYAAEKAISYPSRHHS